MTRPVFEIPITLIGGASMAFRARLAAALVPVPDPDQEETGVWALHRRVQNKRQKWTPSVVPELCHGPLSPKSLKRTPMTHASAADKDRYGGLAWSLLSELDHYGECRSVMMNRNWFFNWSTYVLPQGTLVCPENPARALEELMTGYGASEMEDKVARGVFCVLAEQEISNHGRLELATQASRLIAGLLDVSGRPDIAGDPAYQVNPSA